MLGCRQPTFLLTLPVECFKKSPLTSKIFYKYITVFCSFFSKLQNCWLVYSFCWLILQLWRLPFPQILHRYNIGTMVIYSLKSHSFIGTLCIDTRTPNKGINRRNLKFWADVTSAMWQTKYASAVSKNWDWDLIFRRAVKVVSSPGVCSPWLYKMSNGIALK